MLKNAATVLIITASVGACAAPQVDMAAELEAVRARSEGIVAAESAQDIDGALAYWAPDGVALPANAPLVEGHEGLRELYGQFFVPSLKSFGSTTTHTEVSASGDVAWEYGINRLVFTGPDGDIVDLGKYLATWRKIDGEWYVAVVSFSSDAPPPAPTEQ